MKKLHVFDIDGTILTSDHLHYVLKNKFYKGLTKDNFKYYDLHDSLVHAGMKNAPQNSEIFKLYGTDILMGSELDQTFLPYFEQKILEKEEFIFLTARHSNQHFITKYNFKNTVLEEFLDKVYYVGNKKGNTENDKFELIQQLGFNSKDVVLYEDRTATANLFSDKGSFVYLVNQPYNIQKETKNNVQRIVDYRDLM